MTQIRDQVYEQTLEAMLSKFPELVGTTPNWPRFDRFKQVYTSLNANRLLLDQAITDNNLNGTILQIGEMIAGLNAMAICMGVDLRPVMEALHRRDMYQGDLPSVPVETILADILEFQEPISSMPEEPVTA